MSNVTINKNSNENRWEVKVDGRSVGFLDHVLHAKVDNLIVAARGPTAKEKAAAKAKADSDKALQARTAAQFATPKGATVKTKAKGK